VFCILAGTQPTLLGQREPKVPMSRFPVTSVQDRVPSPKYIAESTFRDDINDIDYHLQMVIYQNLSHRSHWDVTGDIRRVGCRI
jgi:hypothetical protein